MVVIYIMKGTGQMIALIKRLMLAVMLCLTVLQLYTTPAYALEEYRFTYMSPPLLPVPLTVTSAYGPRKLNGHDFHYGIDFDAYYGQEVHAVADGVVITAYDSGHDGGIIFIEHEKNWYSVYIDLLGKIPIGAGDTVKAGQVIGQVGWPPGSTGPHLHFEVKTIDPNTKGILPWMYAPFAPWLPDNAVSDAVRSKLSMSFSSSFDFTGKIKETIDTIAEACTKAVDLLSGIIGYTITILMTIDLSISFMLSSISEKSPSLTQGGFLVIFVRKVFLYCFLFFAITHWTGFLANGVRDFFMSMGALSTGSELEAAKTIVADPFSIVARGAKVVEPIFLCMSDVEAGFRFDFLNAIAEATLPAFFFFLIFACFILIAIQVSIAYIEFYLVIVFGYVTFMFAGWEQTRRYAANGLSGIFTSAIKLMVVTFYACVMTAIVNNMVVEDLVTEKDTNIGSVFAHSDGNFKDIHEFMGAIRLVETGGNPESYITPSSDGWGYGTYQISYENWDAWCAEAGITDIPPMPWPEDSWAWYTSYGDRSIPYNHDWHTELPPAPTPWPPSVQDAVATYKMQMYYNQFGSWQKVAYAWNGGPGRAENPIPAVEAYWERVCNASGAVKRRMHTLNYPPILLLTLFCIFFVMIGDRVINNINKMFGKGGFIFTSEGK